MNGTTKGTPKDVFSYLSWLITLYIGLTSFVWLLFEFIERAFPKATDYASLSAMRGIVAELTVIFPIFLALSWSIRKDISQYPEKLNMRVRKWFLSLTLFLVSAIFVSDLVYLLYNFLDGELEVRYVLKSLTVIFVMAGVFWYYLWDLKGLWVNSGKPKLVAGLVSVAVLVGVGFGFYTVGTPWQQRSRNHDRTRVSDLQILERTILDYHRQNSSLPKELTDLKGLFSYQLMPPVDPETKEPYEYRVVDQNSFELCATFKTKLVPDAGRYPELDSKWHYEPGRKCFSLKVEQSKKVSP